MDPVRTHKALAPESDNGAHLSAQIFKSHAEWNNAQPVSAPANTIH